AGGVVASAPNAEIALEQVPVFRPTVVVSDLSLPGMDGVALCRKLRSRVPAPGVILVTGHADAVRMEGFAAVLSKPLDIEDLAAAVRLASSRASVETDTAPAP